MDEIRNVRDMPDDETDDFSPEDAIHMPIDGTLDLHTFSPKELPGLLDDYFSECREQGILDVRVIHGKGKGILRDRVRSILTKHPSVAEFSTGSHGSGGWGATLVRLKPKTRKTP